MLGQTRLSLGSAQLPVWAALELEVQELAVSLAKLAMAVREWEASLGALPCSFPFFLEAQVYIPHCPFQFDNQHLPGDPLSQK